MNSNIVTAVFGEFREVSTRALYKWDYGQILRFEGLDLPDNYIVHFSNDMVGGESVTMIGNAAGVDIPNECLTTGKPVYAWVFLNAGADDGETVYSVIIPVKKRPRPCGDEPTPVQQGAIEQAIAALNTGVAAAQEAAQDAEQIASDLGDFDTAMRAVTAAKEEAAVSATNASTAAGEAADSAAEAAQTLANVRTEGAAQISAIDAEGQEVLDSIPADYADLSADVVELKSQSPSIVTPEETEADLYIADPQGNVIAEFVDGHFKTKNFDSANSGGSGDVAIKYSTETDVDLDLCDAQGNVLVRYRNGAIQTKRFNSNDVSPAIETFSASKTYARGSVNVLTIQGPFTRGDEIYYHLADGNRYDSYGRYATYYEGSNVIVNNRRGSNGYYRHIVSADCATVGLSIGTAEYTDGTELTLYVYRKHRDVEPIVVTVKADGTGMFATIKEAVDSITDANHLTNPYVIEVYPGIYDCLDGFTDEEIASADTGGAYTQDSMVGIKLTDGMSIRGVGRCDDIILTAELDPTQWSSAVRGQISTLNIEGEGNIENLTIIGKHIRYCVHDDFLSPVNSHDKRILRNIKCHGEYLSYYPLFTAYGAGMSAPRDYLIENCDFGYDLGIHSVDGYRFGCTIEVNNCSGNRFRIGDNATSNSDAVNRVIVNNCNFRMLKLRHEANATTSHMILEGVGNENTMVEDPLMSMYRLGMIDRVPLGVATGKMVALNGLTCEVTADKSVACGVVIGSDTDYCYIQKCGYLPLNYLGITGVAVGDYLTVDSTGTVVTGGTASNAIAVVKSVDDITAFAELLI